jgi:hypothetical protein
VGVEAGDSGANDGQAHILPVRGRVSMLVGAGGNITVAAGDDGVPSWTPHRVDDRQGAGCDSFDSPRGTIRISSTRTSAKIHRGNEKPAGPRTIRFRIATDRGSPTRWTGIAHRSFLFVTSSADVGADGKGGAARRRRVAG